jgi:hypothetical protein
MKTYTITMKETVYYTVTVDAFDQDDAENKAWAKWPLDADYSETETESVKEIKG